MILFIFIVPELSTALGTTFSSDYWMDERRKMQTRLTHVSTNDLKNCEYKSEKTFYKVYQTQAEVILYIYMRFKECDIPLSAKVF